MRFRRFVYPAAERSAHAAGHAAAPRRHARVRGQALVEYALILSLISLTAIISLRGIGQSIETKLQSVNANLE